MATSKVKTMIKVLFVSYLLSILLILALSFAFYKLKLGEGQTSLAIYGIYVISCLIAGLTAGKSIRQRRFFWGMLSGVLYFLVLFLVSLAFNHGLTGNLNQLMTVLAMCAASGTVGGMLS